MSISFVVACALFLIYSFFGWLFEGLISLVKKHKFINRGFLIGPLIPIWGTGAVLITLILKPHDSWFNLIVSSAFIGTTLEYVVNYIMEKLFHARWWDYSEQPFNINGRVCLTSSIVFGLGGLWIVKLINPMLFSIFELINPLIFKIIVFIFMLLFLTDFTISFNIIQKLKISADSARKDYTEEISKKVRATLMRKSFGFRRLLKAFPDTKFSLKKK